MPIWRKLALFAMALVLVGCRTPCAKVSCAAPSLWVDAHRLPAEWLRAGRVDLCADARCVTLRGAVDSPLTSVSVPLPTGSVAPKKVFFAVQVRGRTMLSVTSRRRFRVSTSTSRCPDCKGGSVFVAIDRRGHFTPWDGN